jgi:hypothetical protein
MRNQPFAFPVVKRGKSWFFDVIRDGRSFTEGPFATREEAANARSRLARTEPRRHVPSSLADEDARSRMGGVFDGPLNPWLP